MGTRDGPSPEATPKRLFINYRREDAEVVAVPLHRDLEARFPHDHFFLDTQGVPGGEPWPDRISEELEQADVVLAVVGPDWHLIQNKKTGRRRLDEEQDWVRLELEKALALKIPVIPLLVRGAPPIDPEVLSSLSGLAEIPNREAMQLRPGDYTPDFDKLVLRLADLGFTRREDLGRLDAQQKHRRMSESISREHPVFLCHNSRDGELAVPLAEALEERGVAVFCSSVPGAIPPTSTWGKAVDKGLKSSSAFVVLLTSSGMTRWMSQECHYAIDKMGRDGSYKILPLLAQGADPGTLPALISTHMGIRLTPTDERDLSKAAERVAAAIGAGRRSGRPVDLQTGPAEAAEAEHPVDEDTRSGDPDAQADNPAFVEGDEVRKKHPSPDISGRSGETRRREPDQTATAREGGYELVAIPCGEFLMGSPEEEEGHLEDEERVHRVVDPTFYLGRYPVTNEEYGRFLAANPGTMKPEFWSDRKYNLPRQPVVGVSWDEALAYCEWAGLRLPSEAEWEYACRAGTTSRFWSGDAEEDLARVGWYGENSGDRLHRVDEKPSNPLGLHDMHGNVFEWCEDSRQGNDEDAPEDGSEAVEGGTPLRALRGGGWNSSAKACRSAYRYWFPPSYRYDLLGFRPALTLPQDP